MRNDNMERSVDRKVLYDNRSGQNIRLRGVSMKDDKGSDKYLLSSVFNALEILDLLSEKWKMGVAEISKELDMGKSSVFRLLYTLETKGYVVKDDSAKYMLGRKFSYFGEIVSNRQDEYAIARPELEKLCELTSETTHLSTLLPNLNVVFVQKVKSQVHNLQTSSTMGYDLPAYGSGTGKVLLSNYIGTEKEAELKKIKFKKFTKNTIMSYEDLLSELEKIRKEGYAIDNEESEIGLGCIAVPVKNSDGTHHLAISVSGAVTRILENREEYIKELKKTSVNISELLGL